MSNSRRGLLLIKIWLGGKLKEFQWERNSQTWNVGSGTSGDMLCQLWKSQSNSQWRKEEDEGPRRVSVGWSCKRYHLEPQMEGRLPFESYWVLRPNVYAAYGSIVLFLEITYAGVPWINVLSLLHVCISSSIKLICCKKYVLILLCPVLL